ncbi:TetR/AcrR family transcriptional regulator [Streptomyces sp. SID3343]|uniref:TetR/AcrR family transcriptional regulator n=1 Tax=Streptomyces sp. SID3343 TaxID=2690260 RepID=UPI00136E67A5|nr:TetR/AcrR family transcriptional regulator [Streptomyces sp. SID3343]MYW00069.1 TetR family transcriptional regulator [Streptomyces sp. SID3343]
MAAVRKVGGVVPPPRGTRPRNRRELILAAAADLFYRRGYADVAMSDIAEAVGMGPSALYRHFKSKQQLLMHVVLAGVASVREALARSGVDDPETVLNAVVAVTLEHREVGVLWQREGRLLPAEERTAVRREVRAVTAVVTGLIRAGRPELDSAQSELLAWCGLGVLLSPSFHQVELPRQEYVRLLVRLGQATLTASPAAVAPFANRSPTAAGIVLGSRREALLAAAARMFAAHGYAGVAIEDIGAAAGIAGPSVYNHFDSKAELLSAAVTRGIEWLLLDMTRALAGTQDHEVALRVLLRSYIRFAAEHHDLVCLLLTEVSHLPESARHRARQAQLEYVAEWTRLLCALRPEYGAAEGRIRVQAALTAINDVARTRHLRDTTGVAETLESVGWAVMGLAAGVGAAAGSGPGSAAGSVSGCN